MGANGSGTHYLHAHYAILLPQRKSKMLYCKAARLRTMKSVLATIFLCILALAENGDQTISLGQKLETNGFNYSVRSQLVEIYLTVAKGNQRIPHLKASDFQLMEDDAPVLIDHINNPEVPLQIVLLFDTSESIRDSMKEIQDEAILFIKSLNPKDCVTLIFFNSELYVYPQLTDDRESILREIRKAQARGTTRLYDAMLLGMNVLTGKSGRKAIVCFTDGQDTSGISSRIAVLKAAARSGYPIYAIGTGAGLELESLQLILGEFSEINGGRAFFIQSLRKLREAFMEIGAELRSAYVLSYYTRVPADGKWHTIRVQTTNPDYSVLARKGFYAKNQKE
jgi:VWFA-related protein